MRGRGGRKGREVGWKRVRESEGERGKGRGWKRGSERKKEGEGRGSDQDLCDGRELCVVR